jgi:hypothetical protein
MYRACEAYQNGAISDTSYTLMLARFDKTMASMLASETAAGAYGRNLAALGGNAATGGSDQKKLADAQDAVKSASTKLQNASALPETDDAAKITKKAAVANASGQLNEAVSNLATLEIQSASTAAQSGPQGAGSTGIGQIIGRSAVAADAVARIHTNFLEDDASGTIIDACVIALDRRRTSPVLNEARNRAFVANQKAASGGQEAINEAHEANKHLKSLENTAPISLAEICATLIQNGNIKDNFLIRLQEEKLNKHKIEANLLIEQLKTQKVQADADLQTAVKTAEAKIAIAKSESEIVANLVKGCTDSITGSKKEEQADKYAKCILLKPK